MTGFWKFNSFVGTLGVVLAIAAYCNAVHSEVLADGIYEFTLYASKSSQKLSIHLAIVAAACMGWQVAMTTLGLLVGFFRAPDVR